jgi:hypothetical protein
MHFARFINGTNGLQKIGWGGWSAVIIRWYSIPRTRYLIHPYSSFCINCISVQVVLHNFPHASVVHGGPRRRSISLALYKRVVNSVLLMNVGVGVLEMV